MKYNLDDKNRQILDILQQDAKLSVKEIASVYSFRSHQLTKELKIWRKQESSANMLHW